MGGKLDLRLRGQIAMLAVLFHVWEVTGNPLWTGMIGLVSAAGMITGGFLGAPWPTRTTGAPSSA